METKFRNSVIRQLKEEAARCSTTMSALVEAGLRRVHATGGPRENQPRLRPPLPSWNGGKELVDIANRDALYDAMELH